MSAVLKRNKIAVFSIVIIVFFFFVAVFAKWVSPFSFEDPTGIALAKPFTGKHLMGTDFLERDVLSRLVYGAQMSMAVGLITALFSLVFGTLFGAISGYVGGRTDTIMMRIVDIFYTFPSIVLAVLIIVMMGRGVMAIVLALVITGWADVSRVVRGQVLQLKEEVYVQAAKALGVSHFPIIFKHIVPNLMGILIVTLTFQVPNAILGESFLSFIGLGPPPPFASWGTLAHDAWKSGAMRQVQYSYLILFPSIAIFLSMLSFNIFGDSLRDYLDPKLKSR
ncbi:MAG: ABC transporter permease [Deltaproteobacteria bacterium]|nr:ABC transporter permease [Deltaproteobacteria bacterium]